MMLNGTHLAVHADDLFVTGAKGGIEHTWEDMPQYVLLKVNGLIKADSLARFLGLSTSRPRATAVW